MSEALDLVNLNLDAWLEVPCRSLPLSRLPILTSIKLHRKKSEPSNISLFVRFCTVIGLSSNVILEILWNIVSSLIGALPIPSNRMLSNTQWRPIRSAAV